MDDLDKKIINYIIGILDQNFTNDIERYGFLVEKGLLNGDLCDYRYFLSLIESETDSKTIFEKLIIHSNGSSNLKTIIHKLCKKNKCKIKKKNNCSKCLDK